MEGENTCLRRFRKPERKFKKILLYARGSILQLLLVLVCKAIDMFKYRSIFHLYFAIK